MISLNFGQFDRKVKYYVVLYVDNIRLIQYLSLGHDLVACIFHLWHEVLQMDHILILATVSRFQGYRRHFTVSATLLGRVQNVQWMYAKSQDIDVG